MKKNGIILVFLLMIFGGFSLQAQTEILEEGHLILKLQASKSNGNNGFAVAYNPKSGYYYAAFGGNANFALETFNSNGTKIFEQKTGYDVRGMWFNPKTKSLEGNAYKGEGLYRLKIGKDGKPDQAVKITGPIDMPDDHSAGNFNAQTNEIWHYKNNKIYIYSVKKHTLKNTIPFYPPYDDYSFVETNLFLTGKKGMELAMFDNYSYELVFFSQETGKIVGKCRIPLSFEPKDMFNISFCNNMLFVFDYNNKIWYGYQVFK